MKSSRPETEQQFKSVVRRRAMLPLLLLSCLSLCSCATRPAAPAKLPEPVPISDIAGGKKPLIVMVTVRDGDPVPFMLDTGTYPTIVDVSLVDKLGKRTGKTKSNFAFYTNSPAALHTAPPLYLAGTRLELGGEVVVVDLSRSLPGLPAKGILGLSCLQNYCIQLDFQARQVRFLARDTLNMPELGRPFTVSIEGDKPIVRARLFKDSASKFCVDTGCWGADFVLHPDLFLRGLSNLKPVLEADGHASENKFWSLYTVNGETVTNDVRLGKAILSNGVRQEAAQFSSLVFASEAYPSVKLMEGTNQRLPARNWMGLLFLARHLVTLDFPGRMMYLRRTDIATQTPPSK